VEIDFDKYPLPKRMRHHVSANCYIPWSELKEKPKSYPPLIDRTNWNEHFSNGLPPNILDVGCGKGKLLLDSSELFPDKNFLGIEVRKSAVNWIKDVITGEKITNCSVLWYSVVNGIPFIESKSIDDIYYLFPDPWPKKKHHKRRAFNTEIIKEFHRVLKPNGHLYLATDVPEVHEYHIELLEETCIFDYKIIEKDEDWDLPVTNKENFCRKKNIPFFRLICTKT